MAHINLYESGSSIGQYNLPGTLIEGEYKFALGKVRKGGGNGVVFEARRYRSDSLLSTCAVKFLKKIDSQSIDRFRNEIRVVSELKHGNISEYFGSGQLSLSGHEVRWMAQELGKRNLREDIERNGTLDPQLLVKTAIQMCDAVKHLHSRGFVHRDIKPDNFVWAEGSGNELLMIDFGLAKKVNEDVSGRPLDQFTKTLEFVGPVFYSSPELIEYAKDKKVFVGPPSDMFQVGKTIWYLATGKVSAGVPSRALCPFGGKLRNLVLAMIDDDPSERPKDFDIVVKELSAF